MSYQKSKDYLTEWQVSYEGSQGHWMSLMSTSENSDTAAIISLRCQDRIYPTIKLSPKELMRDAIHAPSGVTYKNETSPNEPRSIEMGVFRATDKESNYIYLLALPVNKEDQPIYTWSDEKPLHEVKVKWTCLKKGGGIAATHILEGISAGTNIDNAAFNYIGRFVRRAEGDLTMSDDDVLKLLEGSNYKYEKGLNRYEVVQVGFMRKLSIIIDGHPQQCITPLYSDLKKRERAYLIRDKG